MGKKKDCRGQSNCNRNEHSVRLEENFRSLAIITISLLNKEKVLRLLLAAVSKRNKTDYQTDKHPDINKLQRDCLSKKSQDLIHTQSTNLHLDCSEKNGPNFLIKPIMRGVRASSPARTGPSRLVPVYLPYSITS